MVFLSSLNKQHNIKIPLKLVQKVSDWLSAGAALTSGLWWPLTSVTGAQSLSSVNESVQTDTGV